MKERVGTLVGPVAHRMWVSTFHSACARILRREAGKLGLRSSFSIYDQSDSVRLVDYVRRDLNLDPKRFPPRRLRVADLGAEERARDRRAGRRPRRSVPAERRRRRRVPRVPAAAARGVGGRLRRPAAAGGAAVPRAPRRARALAAALPPRARRRVPGHERRPVGARAPALARSTAASWSSATRTRRSTSSAGPTTATSCGSRRRSPRRRSSSSSRTTGRRSGSSTPPTPSSSTTPPARPKHLWTEQVGGELITRYHAEDEHDEAAYVAHEIARLTDTEGCRFSDLAVFYRTNAQSRVIEETLVRAGHPVPRRRRRAVLRPARGEGHARVPARRS